MWQEKLWREVNGKPFMGILDNIAGRKTFEYATFGRSGVQQSNSKLFGLRPEKIQIYDMSVSMTVVANAAQQGQGAALETQIDRGRFQYDSTPDTDSDPIYTYGYGASGEDWHNSSGYGSIDNATYTDGSSTSRTIKSMAHEEPAWDDDLIFSLDTASVSDSDATWLDITWDNISGTPITVTRASDLTSYTASLNGSTHWRDLTPTSNWSDLDINTDFVLTTS